VSEPTGIPPIGPVLGVAAHLERCPLCGGPNPHSNGTAAPPPLPVPCRPPSAPPRTQPVQLQTPPSEVPPGPPAPRPGTLDPLDHPVVGGRLTICVLCYGDHADLAQRCLGSILETVPRNRLDLRVGANACSAATLAYLKTLPLTKLYEHAHNAYKYPVMREMFHDPACPILTPYVIWFDDDSHAAHPRWPSLLAETIVQNHSHGVRLYGARKVHDLAMYMHDGHRPELWFRTAPWHRGVPWSGPGSEAPLAGGTCIHFASGGFWALGVEALQRGDIPDRRLRHRGGDITIGAQVKQAGFRCVSFSSKKELVRWSDAPKRGYNEPFPWAPPGSAPPP